MLEGVGIGLLPPPSLLSSGKIISLEGRPVRKNRML